MNRQNMAKWCRELKAGRTEVHDEKTSGRPSFKKLRKNFALISMQ
jgi:hypothetical protein